LGRSYSPETQVPDASSPGAKAVVSVKTSLLPVTHIRGEAYPLVEGGGAQTRQDPHLGTGLGGAMCMVVKFD
jgi:hypothetical protein